jgi:hypothetical protein
LGDIEDLTYLNNRLFSALKVPKAFLGFEGDVNSKGTLSQQNVTFGKAIQNIQEDFLEVVKTLCIVHLAIKGITDQAELKSFNLIMTRPSYVEEKSRIELDEAAMTLAGSYLSQGINKNWVLKNILKKDEADITEMLTLDPAAAAAAAQGGMMGGLGGGGGMLGGLGGGDLGGGAETGGPVMAPGGIPATPAQGGPPNQLNPGNLPAPEATGGQGAPLTQSRKYTNMPLYEGAYINTSVSVKSPISIITEYKNLIDQQSAIENAQRLVETVDNDDEILDSLVVDTIAQNTERLVD